MSKIAIVDESTSEFTERYIYVLTTIGMRALSNNHAKFKRG